MNFDDDPEGLFQQAYEQEEESIFDKFIAEQAKETSASSISGELSKSTSDGSQDRQYKNSDERRLKNRLAARKSRERRLSHIADLEAQVGRYRHEIAVLSLKLQAAHTEVAHYKNLATIVEIPITPPNSLTDTQIKDFEEEILAFGYPQVQDTPPAAAPDQPLKKRLRKKK